MCSHLISSRVSQVYLWTDLTSPSPRSPQGHYSDSGPHSPPLWSHLSTITCSMHIFWKPIMYQAFTRHREYSRDQMRQEPCSNEAYMLLQGNRKQIWRIRKGIKHSHPLPPWFDKIRSLSSSQIFRVLVILLYSL